MAIFNWPALSTTAAPLEFTIDGASTTVNKDTITPANSTPLPVINYNSDGTITDLSSIDSLLTSIDSKDFATETTLSTISGNVTTLAAVDFATQTTSAEINSKLGTLEVVDFATETTLNDISGKLPAVLGPSLKADSFSITLASDQEPIETNVKTLMSTNNTTTSTLLASGVFTGTGDDVSEFGVISVSVYSDVASAALGLEFQASHDNVTWYVTDAYTIPAVTLKHYSLAPELKYFRVKYTNDGSPQSTFLIETSYRQTYVKPSSHRIGDTISANDDAELTTSQIVGLTTGGGGGYVAVKCTPSGSLTTDTTVSSSALPTGASTLAEQQTQSTTLSNISGKLPATLGQKSMANSLAVTMASDQGNINVAVASALPTGTNTIGYVKKAGLVKSNTPVYNDYSSTNVTTSAYVQLIASTTAEADMIHIFDSSGEAMILATGGAGSEVDQLYVPPGGGDFNLFVTAGTRISIKAKTATATSGYLLINLLG